jgi:Tfp pilus assembly protein PilF
MKKNAWLYGVIHLFLVGLDNKGQLATCRLKLATNKRAKKNLREATQSVANSQDPSTSYAMIYTSFEQGSYAFWANDEI